MNDVSDTDSHGSGGYTAAGIEYQISVSVWLALELVLSSKRTHELILEPASQEDAEAEIAAEAALDGYTLVVQAKLRTGDPWRISDFNRLLQHGGINRVSAADRLNDIRTRYLLVTSAGLNREGGRLGVGRPGAWPRPGMLPTSTANILPVSADGRVAIIGNHDPDRLRMLIKDLLTDAFRVPRIRWEECRQALENEARVRISHGGSSRWTRAELEAIISHHEGYIASSPELDNYVRPRNWNSLIGAIENRHALMIIGQSGTGKTTTVDALWDAVKAERRDLKRVRITKGPEQFRSHQIDGPAFYDIEDPWGKYRFEPDRRPWNSELSNALASARHDRIVVATSRRDVAEASGALKNVEMWAISLEAEHYGQSERHRLYRSRISRLSENLKQVAFRNERHVLSELKTPLEIQKFFDALTTPGIAESNNEAQLVHAAINQAHENAIEQTVVDQIEARNGIKPAAALWGLLKVSPSLSLSTLPVIEEELYERDPGFETGVSPLIKFFIAARNLRQSEDRVSYYHPRVEAGIGRALSKEPLSAKRGLSTLADAFIALGNMWSDWDGAAAAAELVAAGAKSDGLSFRVSASTQLEIDLWLNDELSRPGQAFEARLKLAALIGSPDNTPSEVARWLYHRPDDRFPNFMYWGEKPIDPNWYARMRADPVTKLLVEIFVRDVLPFDRDRYPSDFSKKLRPLAGDMSNAFFDAAMTAVHFGASEHTDAILEGAMEDLDRFEHVVRDAFQILTPTDSERQKSEETYLAIVNEEYGEAYGEHVADNDDGYAANQFIRAYAERLRTQKGWQRLEDHALRDGLRSYWLNILQRNLTPAKDPAEVSAVFAASYGSTDECELWSVVRVHWNENFMQPLLDRIENGHSSGPTRRAALGCLLKCGPAMIGRVIDALCNRQNNRRLVSVALELASLANENKYSEDSASEAVVLHAINALPPDFREVGWAALAIDSRLEVSLSPSAISIVLSVADPDEELRLFRIELAKSIPLEISDDVMWLLDNTDNKDIAVSAVELAIQYELPPLIERSLNHRFAHVVAAAITALGAGASGVIPQRLLDKVSVRGRPVQKALLDLLETRREKEHVPTLLTLAHNTWSGREYHQEEQDYPLARRAVAILGAYDGLTEIQLQELYTLSLDTQDIDLRFELMAVVVKHGGYASQHQLFDLAIKRNRPELRRSAIKALSAASNVLDDRIVGLISVRHLTHNAPGVSVELVIIIGERGSEQTVRLAAEALALNLERRVFLVLLVAAVAVHNRSLAEQIAEMLPFDHIGRAWALDQPIGDVGDDALDDLGDVGAVAQVLPYMKADLNSGVS